MTDNINNIPDEIDLIEIAREIYSKKIFILISTVLIAVGSVFYALSLPNIYTSDAVLEISSKSQTGGGGGSQLGLAMNATITLSSDAASDSSKAQALLVSRETMKSLLAKENIMRDLFEFESYDPITKTSTYNNSLTDETTGLKKIPSYLVAHKVFLSNAKIFHDKFTGFINISFSHGSPEFAQKMINLLVAEVNFMAREKDLAETQESLDFLNKKYVDTNIENIRVTIGSLIESQLKKQMFAFISENYILSFIDPPIFPEQISSPNRRYIVMTWTILGVIFSIIFVITRYFLRKAFNK